MREVTQTFSVLEQNGGHSTARYFPGPPSPIGDDQPDPHDCLLMSESEARVNKALSVLPPDERLAVKLFVMEELPAATVARTLVWPNAKQRSRRVVDPNEFLLKRKIAAGVTAATKGQMRSSARSPSQRP